MLPAKMPDLWHLRLGHLPFNQLYFLFPDLKVNNVDKEMFCTIFPLANKAREPSPRSEIKFIHCFQLLHIVI